MKKVITVVVPTYREELNIIPVYDAVTKVFTEQLPNYDYEIMYVDNDSPDGTRALIRQMCKQDPAHVKAIFNARNFGQNRSHFYALTQAQGDAAVMLHADLQNPPEIIPQFVAEWEKGSKVVIGIKDDSKESKLMFFLRTCYYKMMKKLSDVEQIEHFSDFSLLDRDFLDVLRDLEDPLPYLRGIISELGFRMTRIHYHQNKRERGKTNANLHVIYDYAMLGITSYSKSIVRFATIGGFCLSGISLIIALLIFIKKLLFWNSFSTGIACIGVGVFLLGSVQLFFIGLLGEYIVNMNVRIMKRPLVVEECRLNFGNGTDDYVEVDEEITLQDAEDSKDKKQ